MRLVLVSPSQPPWRVTPGYGPQPSSEATAVSTTFIFHLFNSMGGTVEEFKKLLENLIHVLCSLPPVSLNPCFMAVSWMIQVM